MLFHSLTPPCSLPEPLTYLCSPAPGSLSPDAHLPPSQLLNASSDGLPATPPPDESPSLKVFRCLVCQTFSTDSLELLLYHCSVGRSLPEAEWKEVAGDTHRCKLCCYGTQLKANFQLHLKTDKHAQKYQLAAHLREGGGTVGTPSPGPLGEVAPYGSISLLHLRCNICDFESNSKEKMQLHVRGSAHEENSQIYKVRLGRMGLCQLSLTCHCHSHTRGHRIGRSRKKRQGRASSNAQGRRGV